MVAKKDPPVVRSVARALSLLDLLRPGGITLTALAEETGLAVPTVHRIVRTLEASEYVTRSPKGHYLPGPAVVRLTFAVGPYGPTQALLRDALTRVRSEFDETVALFVREGARRVCVESVQSSRLVRAVYEPGMSGPIHRGAAGKVLMAFSDTDELIAQVPVERGTYELGIEGRTRRRKLKDLVTELEEIASQGYAHSTEEEIPDLWSVSAPILVGDMLLGALALVAPISRHTETLERRAAKVVRATADDLQLRRLRPSALIPESRWSNVEMESDA